jgi:hypothetical protein
MRRLSLIAITVLGAAWTPGVVAQSEAWKVFVRAQGTWSSLRGVEISSQGTLVTNEGKREEMPRCMQLTAADVEYLSERVADIRRSIDERRRWEQRWPSTAIDNDIADITIRWPGTDDFVRLKLPLARRRTGGSPPEFVLELLERSWQLREAATSLCYARP